MQYINKLVCIILLSPVISNSAYADCFGKNILQGEITAGGNHPRFKLEANFDSKSVIVAGNVGTISDVNCIKRPDGNQRVFLKFQAHIEYKCEGSAYGSDAMSVNLQCDGSNTSKNTVTGRLLKF